MSEKVALIKRFVEIAFERFDLAIKDLAEKEIDWRPLKETNSIRWILTHLSQQWNMGIHKILKGDPEYKPKDWSEDYIDNRSYSLDKIMSDLERGRKNFISGLEELTLEELRARQHRLDHILPSKLAQTRSWFWVRCNLHYFPLIRHHSLPL